MLLPEINLLADLIEGRLRPKATPDGMSEPAPTDATQAQENIAPTDENGRDSDMPKPDTPNQSAAR